jgi:hypothetical protein
MAVQDRIGSKLEKKLRLAIGKLSDGERVEWDYGLQFLPQAPPFYYVTLSIPSHILGGQPVIVGAIMQDPTVDQDAIDEIVGNALSAMKEERSKQLTEPSVEAQADLLSRFQAAQG